MKIIISFCVLLITLSSGHAASIVAEYVAEDEAAGNPGDGFYGDGWNSRRPKPHDNIGAGSGTYVTTIADLDAQAFVESVRAVRTDGINDFMTQNTLQGAYHGIDNADRAHVALWLSPDSWTGGRQVIWETGGGGDGTGIVLLDSNLYLGSNNGNVRGVTPVIDLNSFFTPFGYSPSNDYLHVTASMYTADRNRIDLAVADRFGNKVVSSFNFTGNFNDWTGGDGTGIADQSNTGNNGNNNQLGGNRSNQLRNLDGGGQIGHFAGMIARIEYSRGFIPEPSTTALLFVGIGGLAALRRKRLQAPDYQPGHPMYGDLGDEV